MQNVLREYKGDLARRLRHSIERIGGVVSASVILNASGDVEEIHLVGSSTRRPKQIVRDTESLLCAHFGIRVDYRKISLVQLDPEQVPAGCNRLQFVSATPHPQKADCVQITLSANDNHYEGVAPLQAGLSDESMAHAAANATLFAVQKAVDQIPPLKVQGMQIVPDGDHRVCLAIISVSTSKGEERLIGTSLIVDNLFEAASKATLDAINRRLILWTAGHGAASSNDPPLSLSRIKNVR